jgi:hypothetical protein
MTAKQKAILDIKQELRDQAKAFIAFRTELNPIMDELVSDYYNKEEESCSHQ